MKPLCIRQLIVSHSWLSALPVTVCASPQGACGRTCPVSNSDFRLASTAGHPAEIVRKSSTSSAPSAGITESAQRRAQAARRPGGLAAVWTHQPLRRILHACYWAIPRRVPAVGQRDDAVPPPAGGNMKYVVDCVTRMGEIRYFTGRSAGHCGCWHGRFRVGRSSDHGG
jgi:hypothetical protein